MASVGSNEVLELLGTRTRKQLIMLVVTLLMARVYRLRQIRLVTRKNMAGVKIGLRGLNSVGRSLILVFHNPIYIIEAIVT